MTRVSFTIPEEDLLTAEHREKLEWANRASRALGLAFRNAFEREYAKIMGLDYPEGFPKEETHAER